MEFLESLKIRYLTKDGEILSRVEIYEAVSIIIITKNLRVLYIFVPNKSFSQLLDILPKKLFLIAFNSEISYIELWLTYQSSKQLGIEDIKKLDRVLQRVMDFCLLEKIREKHGSMLNSLL